MEPEPLDFQLLFEAVPAPHLVLTPACTVAALSTTMCRLLGQPREQLVGRAVQQVLAAHLGPAGFHPWEQTLQEVLELRATRILDPVRLELPAPAGAAPAVRYWQVLVRPLLTPLGALRYLMCRILDVTDRVVAQQQGQLNYQSFSTLARTTHDAAWEYNLRTGQVWRSHVFTELFGYELTPETRSPEFWRGLVHPDDLPQLETYIAALEAGRPTIATYHYRLRRHDGSWAEVVDRYHIIRDEDEQPLRLLGVIQDVSQTRANERALHQSLEQFQVLADFIPQLVWSATAEGEMVYVNQRWKTYTGQGTPANWLSLAHPHDQPRAAAAWQQALATATAFECDFRLRGHDGSYQWFLAQARPVPAAAGSPARWFGTCTNIEDQKLTQQLLERKDRKLQLILGNVPALLATVWGPELRVSFINDLANQLLGGGVRSGQSARAAAPYLAEQGLLELLDRVRRTGRPVQARERAVELPDPETGAPRTRYFDFICQRLPAVPGEEQGLLVFAVEVTNQVLTRHRLQALDEELRLQDEQLRVMTESLPQITSVTRPDGSMVYLSPQWFEYTGQTVDDLPHCWQLALHPDDAALARHRFQEALAQRSEFTLEFRLRRHDGQYRWHLSRSVPSLDAQGRVQRVYGACVDVHDQRVLAEELRRSEEQFRFLAESVPAIVWTAQPDGQFDYLNSRWTFHTGVEVERTLREGWGGLLLPEEAPAVQAQYQHSMQFGVSLDMESRLLDTRTGQYRWYLHRSQPLRNPAGQIVRWFGTTTDIDDYKRVQQRLVEKNEELTRTNQDLDSFVYAVSHDLKQPIHNMAGIFEELIRTAFFRDPDAVKLVAMFEKALQQINGTIHDLTELVRIQKLRYEQPAEPVDLAQLTQEVLLSIQDQLDTTRALVEVEVTAVPVLHFVRPHLQSILYNLISNALKYAAPRRRPRLAVRAHLHEGQPVLEVQDNGLGIDLARFGPELFQLFRRFHDHVDGAGLGLYLVNRVVQNAGGRISVDSTVNEGSTFRVLLPASTLPGRLP